MPRVFEDSVLSFFIFPMQLSVVDGELALILQLFPV